MGKIGIIGGSGLYKLLEGAESIEKETEYGSPSDRIALGSINGKDVAFIPRHGSSHTIPPHKVPYRANIEALRALGIDTVIATSAVGSLKTGFVPGDFVLFDQFINATCGREDTFFNGPKVVHVSAAEPYCGRMRELALAASLSLGIRAHDEATVVVINGPRFSTKAESRLFAESADVVNMTQYPEVMLAREKGICYLGIGIITDYDSGLEGDPDIKPVSYEEVSSTFARSTERLKELIHETIKSMPEKEVDCVCRRSLEGAEAKA